MFSALTRNINRLTRGSVTEPPKTVTKMEPFWRVLGAPRAPLRHGFRDGSNIAPTGSLDGTCTAKTTSCHDLDFSRAARSHRNAFLTQKLGHFWASPRPSFGLTRIDLRRTYGPSRVDFRPKNSPKMGQNLCSAGGRYD